MIKNIPIGMVNYAVNLQTNRRALKAFMIIIGLFVLGMAKAQKNAPEPKRFNFIAKEYDLGKFKKQRQSPPISSVKTKDLFAGRNGCLKRKPAYRFVSG